MQKDAKSLTDDAVLAKIARWLPLMLLGNLIVGLPTLLISLVVAYGTFVQAGATQRMQQAAAWPFVAYRSGNYSGDGKRLINLSLTNSGLGPALVGPVEVIYKGRAMRSPVELLSFCCGYKAGESMQLQTLPIVNITLRPGEETIFFGFPDVPANSKMVDRLDSVREEIKVRACYCSLFDDCWIVEGAQAQPDRVNACPTSWTSFRQR